MKPLSKNKRVWYLRILSVVFVIIVPVIILYASGYRLTELFEVSRTGGVYVGVGQSGAEVYLDGKLVKKTSIFQKSVFVQDLKPNVYRVVVKKNDFQSWEKEIRVFPETVAETMPFLLPAEPKVVEITKTLLQNSVGTTTSTGSKILNPEYTIATELFKTKPQVATSSKATTTTAHKFSLKISGKSILIHWIGKEEDMPSFLCEGDLCKSDVVITALSKVTYADFFPGREDLIIYSIDNGIFVSEIDDRSAQNVQKLYVEKNAEFRVKDRDSIYVKNGGKYYRVEF